MSQNRHSLMLDGPAYSKITALAKKGHVARPFVVDALLELVDEAKLIAKLGEVRANSKAQAVEERKKRAALSQLASSLTMEQIEALTAKVQK
jgi:hypothetical protein